jgi:RNA polymerase sigma-70 factor (ECF subfamily)
MSAPGDHDTEDFGRFMRAEYAATVRHIVPLAGTLAEDVAQDAFLAAYASWERVRTLEAPHAWVRLVARRMASRQRARERARPRHEAEAQPTGSRSASADARIDIRRAIRDLPANQRTAVRLHYHADMPVAAVALTMAASESAVKVWLHRARTAIGESLLGGRGTWLTADAWAMEDLERAIHASGMPVHHDVLLEELPLGGGRWAVQLEPSAYRIETDEGRVLDHGRARFSRTGLELRPWNDSGTVLLDADIDTRFARFAIGSDTTAPTRGVPDDVFLRLILATRVFERQGGVARRSSL